MRPIPLQRLDSNEGTHSVMKFIVMEAGRIVVMRSLCPVKHTRFVEARTCIHQLSTELRLS